MRTRMSQSSIPEMRLFSKPALRKHCLANDHAQRHDRKIKLQELPKSLLPHLWRRRNFARRPIILIGDKHRAANESNLVGGGKFGYL